MENIIPEDLAATRRALLSLSLDACAEPQVDNVYHTFGVPRLSVSIEPPEENPDVLGFGDFKGSWGPRSFVDGSCLQSSIPEVARAGWSVVQIGDNLLPQRAVYGALPGPRQTIGRAERWTFRQALAWHPKHESIVSDLQSAVREGNAWDPEQALGTAKHATIWRSIFQLGLDSRPQFEWCPAHRSLDDVLAVGGCVKTWAGNLWADFFAKLGAQSHAFSDGFAQAISGELSLHTSTLRFIAWGAQKLLADGHWTVLDPLCQPRLLSTPSPTPVALTCHDIWRSSKTEAWRCRKCGRTASNLTSLRALLTHGSSRICAPSDLQQHACDAWFSGPEGSLFAPWREEAVRVAMGAADRFLGVADQDRPPTPESGEADQAVFADLSRLGHDPFAVHHVFICRKCGAHGALGSFRKLANPCAGPSKVSSTLSNQRQAVRRMDKGLHPKTGAKITAPSSLGPSGPAAPSVARCESATVGALGSESGHISDNSFIF